MFVDKWSYRQRIIYLEPTLLSHEITWLNRLSKHISWHDKSNSFNLTSYVKKLALLRLVNFKQEVKFIIRFLSEFVEISVFIKRHLLRLQLSIVHRKQILPTSGLIYDSLKSMNVVEQLFMLVLASSGRRSTDIFNVKSSNIVVSGKNFSVKLDRDKMNDRPVKFIFSWDKSLNIDWQNVDFYFKKLLSLETRPFQSVSVQRLRRISSFHIHGLRNRRSLLLIRDGLSVEEVKSAVGWSSDQSFLRYTKINIVDIKRFLSLDELIEYLNSE